MIGHIIHNDADPDILDCDINVLVDGIESLSQAGSKVRYKAINTLEV